MLKTLADVQEILMRGLRLMHNPVSIRFFFDQSALDEFKKKRKYFSPIRPLTFCQAELGARMEGMTIIQPMDKLWCQVARYGFALRDMEENDIRQHSKFVTDDEQARRFIDSKPRLHRPLLAASFSPLEQEEDEPDVIHFICDNMQAYHILNDWMAVQDVHPLHPNLCVNSAICGGAVYCFNEGKANLTLACGGSYNSGKTERGEINVMIPGGHIRAVAQRLAERMASKGGPSLTRLGEPFPGADICQNCPVILFKPGHDAQETEQENT